MSRWAVPVAGHCARSGKRCFATRKHARDAARKTGPHCSVYRCQHCGHMHVTSQPERLGKAITYLLRSLP